jgi:hypothetical protein
MIPLLQVRLANRQPALVDRRHLLERENDLAERIAIGLDRVHQLDLVFAQLAVVRDLAVLVVHEFQSIGAGRYGSAPTRGPHR